MTAGRPAAAPTPEADTVHPRPAVMWGLTGAAVSR
jgi:hypothetical protein